MAEHETTMSNLEKLKSDPETLHKLVNKYVRIELIKNISFYGFLYSIDPISNSIILLVLKEVTYSPVIIPGHAVLDILEELPPSDVDRPPRKVEAVSEIDLNAKKKQLIDWLKWNMLPSSESGDSIVFRNVVHLLPPYSVKDICTTNTLVAMELTKVIEKMPKDFQIET